VSHQPITAEELLRLAVAISQAIGPATAGLIMELPQQIEFASFVEDHMARVADVAEQQETPLMDEEILRGNFLLGFELGIRLEVRDGCLAVRDLGGQDPPADSIKASIILTQALENLPEEVADEPGSNEVG